MGDHGNGETTEVCAEAPPKAGHKSQYDECDQDPRPTKEVWKDDHVIRGEEKVNGLKAPSLRSEYAAPERFLEQRVDGEVEQNEEPKPTSVKPERGEGPVQVVTRLCRPGPEEQAASPLTQAVAESLSLPGTRSSRDAAA